MKEVYEAIAEIHDFYGIPVLCEVICHECYDAITSDENFFPAAYHFFATYVSEKPLKCEICGREITRKAYMEG